MRVKFFLVGLVAALAAEYSQAINLSTDDLPSTYDQDTGLGQIDANIIADADKKGAGAVKEKVCAAAKASNEKCEEEEAAKKAAAKKKQREDQEKAEAARKEAQRLKEEADRKKAEEAK